MYSSHWENTSSSLHPQLWKPPIVILGQTVSESRIKLPSVNNMLERIFRESAELKARQVQPLVSFENSETPTPRTMSSLSLNGVRPVVGPEHKFPTGPTGPMQHPVQSHFHSVIENGFQMTGEKRSPSYVVQTPSPQTSYSTPRLSPVGGKQAVQTRFEQIHGQMKGHFLPTQSPGHYRLPPYGNVYRGLQHQYTQTPNVHPRYGSLDLGTQYFRDSGHYQSAETLIQMQQGSILPSPVRSVNAQNGLANGDVHKCPNCNCLRDTRENNSTVLEIPQHTVLPPAPAPVPAPASIESAPPTSTEPDKTEMAPRRRGRKRKADAVCTQCSLTQTPEWRRGPEGVRTLCNACGLFYSKVIKKWGMDDANAIFQYKKIHHEENDRTVPPMAEKDAYCTFVRRRYSHP